MKYTEEEILAYARKRIHYVDLQKGKRLVLGFMGVCVIAMFFCLERVLKLSQPGLRRGRAAGFVAPQLQISLGYAPSSRLAIGPAALAIPCLIYF